MTIQNALLKFWAQQQITINKQITAGRGIIKTESNIYIND
jgi:hypothetical protein